MKVHFIKMHGSSNDFVMVDEWKNVIIPEDKKADFSVRVSERHTGIGSDGVIFVQKSEKADAKFIFYNPDGTIAEMCGNGIRCFAKYIYDTGHVAKTNLNVETLAGIKNLKLTLFNDKVEQVRVDMGSPQLMRGEIGITGDALDTFIDQKVDVDGIAYSITAVGTGNPHAVLFVDDVNRVDVVGIGQKIRNMHEIFPKGVNVHFVQDLGRNEFRIRSYERGVENETLACGTGVCASAVAAVIRKKLDPRKMLRFFTLGGELNVEFEVEEGKITKVFLIGPVVEAFRGDIEYDPSEKFQKAAYSFIERIIHTKFNA